MIAHGGTDRAILICSPRAFDQSANLTADSRHDIFLHPPGADAEPSPELDFGQTLGWQICAAEMAY